MRLSYKKLYESVMMELDFVKGEREKLKQENALLEKIRMIQTEHLLKREKMIKDMGGKV
ncbi:hypothetical protein [Pedobacter frigoris]|uniref:hypothetical protein n=1 Tax=Pedobacter frigoris TaxID=2571272 RepID=UPI002931A88F|nr:hypothetical protein [Pedobacter frigoris]